MRIRNFYRSVSFALCSTYRLGAACIKAFSTLGTYALAFMRNLLSRFFYKKNRVRNSTHTAVRGRIFQGKSIVNTNNHSRGSATIKLDSIFCTENAGKLCLLIYRNTYRTACITAVNNTNKACAILLEAHKGSGGSTASAVIGMAICINYIIINKNVVSADHPTTAFKLTGGKLISLYSLAVGMICEYIVVSCGINNRILTAFKCKGLSFLNTGSSHSIIRSIYGIVGNTGFGSSLYDHCACVCNSVRSCNVKDSDLT